MQLDKDKIRPNDPSKLIQQSSTIDQASHSCLTPNEHSVAPTTPHPELPNISTNPLGGNTLY